MCFSATASFAASAALSIMAILTYQQVRQRRWLGLATVPFLFALQQFLEGLIWLSYQGYFNPDLRQLFSYGFLFFAYLLWPAYIPAVLLQLEPQAKQRKYLKLCGILGSLVALTLAIVLGYGGTTTQLLNCQLVYQTGLVLSPTMTMLASLAYVVSTVGALLISTTPGIRLLGGLLALSYLSALYFYQLAFVSVWCFFAAVLSLLVYWIVRQQRR